MRKLLTNLACEARRWLNRISEVARWNGVVLADFRDRRNQTPYFRETILVHEATHGVLRSRGIDYTPRLRERIERFCVREEQRFLDHLSVMDADLAARLPRNFDARDWHWHWHTSPLRRNLRALRRSFVR